MSATSPTLLQKLRDPSDAVAWERFVDLYLPLLRFWARRLPLGDADRKELVQDVFVKLMREVPKLKYEKAKGAFRSWLCRVCHNHWHDFGRKRANQRAPQLDDDKLDALTSNDTLDDFWKAESAAILMCEAYRLLEKEFDQISRTVFVEVAWHGRSPEVVAQELGITRNALYIRKLRVVMRLREELSDYLD